MQLHPGIDLEYLSNEIVGHGFCRDVVGNLAASV
jgi:hypothetical protein